MTRQPELVERATLTAHESDRYACRSEELGDCANPGPP